MTGLLLAAGAGAIAGATAGWFGRPRPEVEVRLPNTAQTLLQRSIDLLIAVVDAANADLDLPEPVWHAAATMHAYLTEHAIVTPLDA